MKQMQLLCEIDRLVKGGSQFIISTHSPILMTFPGAEVYQLSRQKIQKVDYRETEHFQLTKAFLNAPEKMLGYLLKDGESRQVDDSASGGVLHTGTEYVKIKLESCKRIEICRERKMTMLDKKYDIVSIGEIMVDMTQVGINSQGNPLFAAYSGGAPANIAVAASRLVQRRLLSAGSGMMYWDRGCVKSSKTTAWMTAGYRLTRLRRRRLHWSRWMKTANGIILFCAVPVRIFSCLSQICRTESSKRGRFCILGRSA